jgi:hypothetical protein
LLSLGIDLDDDLISRLQTNLGIERIFSVARKAASLMKDKPNSSTGGTPNIIYRNVSAGSTAAQGASLSPFKTLVHLDGKHSTTLLKDLNNRSSVVEPQHRPAVDKLLESFGVMYARSPDRFVSRMLGRKYKSTDKNDAHAISKLVLKARYVSEEDFATMITRVDASVTPSLAGALFRLLGEDKSFAVNKKRAVVDLWGFFTLLKTAAEQSRRSFDSKTSLLASDVEFWKKKNPSKATPGAAASEAGSKAVKSEFSLWMDANNMSNDMLTAENNRRFNPEANSMPLEERQHPTHKNMPVPHACVAELLGAVEYKHLNDSTHGRQIMGNLVHEVTNTCDVAGALHSPLRSHQNPSPKGRVRGFGAPVTSRDDSSVPNSAHFRGRSVTNTNSSQVGGVLGYQAPPRREFVRPSALDPNLQREGVFGVSAVRPASAGRARPFTAHSNSDAKATVASSLGFGIEDGMFPRKGSAFGQAGSTAEQTARLQRRNSFGQLSRDNRSASVADAMGSSRQDNAGRGAQRLTDVYCPSP